MLIYLLYNKELFVNTIRISIAEDAGSKRGMTINNDLSHYIDTAKMKALLEKVDET